jgi:hypothetical protein
MIACRVNLRSSQAENSSLRITRILAPATGVPHLARFCALPASLAERSFDFESGPPLEQSIFTA